MRPSTPSLNDTDGPNVHPNRQIKEAANRGLYLFLATLLRRCNFAVVQDRPAQKRKSSTSG
jgi:hypothetical protein